MKIDHYAQNNVPTVIKKIGFCWLLTVVYLALTQISIAQITPGSPNNFITEWNTGNTTQLQFRGNGSIPSSNYNYYVYWEEIGNPSNNNSATMNTAVTNNSYYTINNLSLQTEYRIEIAGSFPAIQFAGYNPDWTNATKLRKVTQWGTQQWRSFFNAFYHATDLDITATDIPNLSASNIDMSYMFHLCSSLVGSGHNWNAWNVSNVINMSYMFNGCSQFNQNIGSWNVSNVTNVSYMFNGAMQFNQNISSWNTSKITDMSWMFNSANQFNQSIGTWDVSKVIDMSYMFSNAASFNRPLGAWDVSKVTLMMNMFNNATTFNQNIGAWDVGNVVNMASMFSSAKNFNQDIGGWNVIKVANMGGMFQNATTFNRNIGAWNVSNVVNMSSMFSGATNFNQDIGAWNVGNVTNMASMFRSATNFNKDIGGWNVSSVQNMFGMFASAINFNIDIGAWNTGAVTNMSQMFQGATIFNQNIGNWNTGSVINMSQMFQSAINFNQPIGNWNTENVTNMVSMFQSATLFNQPIGNWNTGVVTSMVRMFYQAINFNQDIGNWNTESVTDMSWMFYQANVFNQNIGAWHVTNVTNMMDMFYWALDFNQDISAWDVSNVTNMEYMFGRTNKFNQELGTWDVSNVTTMQFMFSYSPLFNGNISSWDVSNVTNMNSMFIGDTSFNQNIGSWNVGVVSNFRSMFEQAIKFNQDLGSWNLATATDVSRMFNFSGMDCEKYSATLIGWAASSNTPDGLFLNGPASSNDLNSYNPLVYTPAGKIAHDYLIQTKNWTIDADVFFDNVSKITLSGITEICAGTTGVLVPNPPTPSNAFVQWASNDPTKATVAIYGNGTVSAIDAGNAVITYKLISGRNRSSLSPNTLISFADKCWTTASLLIKIIPKPNVTLISEDNITTVCPGEKVVLSASGATTYVWSGGGLSGGGTTKTINPNITTTYQVVGTGTINNCTDTKNIMITVNPKPNVNITATKTTICAGETITLTRNGNATTWEWDGDPASGTIFSKSVAPTTTTTYTLKGTKDGCDSTKTITITVNPKPAVTLTAPKTALCMGESVNLTAAGASSYVWSGGGLSGGGTIRTVSPTSFTTYTVTGTGSNGCTEQKNIALTVSSRPNVNITAPQTTICAGATVTLSRSGNASTWEWSGGGISGNQTLKTVNPNITTTYQLKGINTSGCDSIKTITIVVNPKPNVNVTASKTTICAGETITLTRSGNATSWDWSGGEIFGNQPTKNASPTTTTTYVLLGTNINNCDSTKTITITVNPKPNVTLNASKSEICIEESVVLTANGASSYVWNGVGVSGGGTTKTVTPTNSTSYIVTGTDANNCKNDTIIDIVVHPKPNVNIDASNTTICNGESVLLIRDGNATTWLWSGGGISGNQVLKNVNPTTNTTYTLKGTANGCDSTTTITIAVNQKPEVNITTSNTTICEGETVTLTRSGNATSWTWSGGGLTGDQITKNVAPTTTTTYTLKGTNANGCDSIKTITIVVNQKPGVNITASKISICEGETITLTRSGNATNWLWSGGGISGNQATKNVSPTTNTTYSLKGTNANGCDSTFSITINVNSKPNVNITASKTTICNGEIVTLSRSGNATTWNWSGGGLTDSEVSKNVSPTIPTTYTLKGTANGCDSTTTVTIVVNQKPSVNIIASKTTICEGETLTLTRSGNATTWAWSGNGTSGNDAVKSVSPTSTTTYTLNGTNANGCDSTFSIIIKVNPKPDVNIDASNTTICPKENVLLIREGNAINWTWSGGGLSGNQVLKNISPTTTTTYMLKGTKDGCDSTFSMTITVNDKPNVTLSATKTTICAGETIILTANGADAYSWNGGNLSGNGTTRTISPTNTTLYSIVGTNANGCDSTTSITITVNQNPTAVISNSGITNVTCNGEATGSAKVTVVGGTGNYTYSWNTNPIQTTQTATSLEAGNYTVTVKDANDCQTTANVEITEPTKLVATIDPADVIHVTTCNGEATGSAKVTVSGGTGNYTYSWNTNPIQTTQTATNLSAGNYTVTVKDASNCTATDNITITQPAGCTSCTEPTLTLNAATACQNGFYSVYATSNGTLSSSSGIVQGDSIVNIPIGTNVIVTATDGLCSISATAISPATCPDSADCTFPSLTTSNGICDGVGSGTYSVAFVIEPSTAVTASAGTVVGNVVSGIPIGTNVTLTAGTGNCTVSVTRTSPANCIDPCATSSVIGILGTQCVGTTYSVEIFNPLGASLGVSVGQVSGNSVINIPQGQNVTLTATASCGTQTVVVNSPANCTPCTEPTLTLNAATTCQNGFYSVYATSNGALVPSSGIVQGDSIINIPIGTNAIVTATDGLCSISATAISPATCPDPADCTFPSLTTSNGICDGVGSGTYSVAFVIDPSTVVTASAGTVVGNVVSGIPIGTNVTLTAGTGNCTVSVTRTSPANCIDPCATSSVIGILGTQCVGTTYSVEIFNPLGASLVASVGQVSGNSVINIPQGQNVTLTVTASCGTQTVVVNSPANCTPCTEPTLTLNAATACQNGFYSVYATSNGTLASSSGIVQGDSIINIPIGTNVVVTATDGLCSISATAISPATCPDPADCTFPSLTTSNGICDGVGSGTYSVAFVIDPSTVVTASTGTVVGNVVSGIPIGTNVTLTAGTGNCTVSVTRTSPANCIDPCATSSVIGILGTQCVGTTYSVEIFNPLGASLGVSVGQVSGNSVINIPQGQNVTLTATASCGMQTVVVNSPANCTPCTEPTLTLNAATACQNGFYSVYATSNGTLSSSSGIVQGDSIINIPIGTNAIVTATDGLCSISATVISPATCPDPADCTFPSLTTSNGICDGVGSGTYSVAFVIEPSTAVTASAGTVVGNVVSGIPIGTNVTLTAGTGNCTVSVERTSPANCIDPCATSSVIGILGTQCVGTTYSVEIFNPLGASLVASVGQVSGNSVINIPQGQNVTLTATASCGTQTVVVNSPANCTPCTEPTLTLNAATTCQNGFYSVYATSNGMLASSSGIVQGDSIVNIPIGTNVVVTATDGLCSISATAISPATCPDPADCTFPSLTTSNGICDGVGSGTYSVAFVIEPSTAVTASAGTVVGNVVSGIPIGTNVTLTAGTGNCTVSVERQSPINCENLCKNGGIIAVVGTTCKNESYNVYFVASANVTIIPSAGTLQGNVITEIPIGTDLTITAILSDCITPQMLTVMSPDVSKCQDGFVAPPDGFDPLKIPNAFSPNGDGKDDFFVIQGLPEGSTLNVYNNWGNIVYSSKNYQNNWDGTCNECILKGDGLPTSTYYYVLELGDYLQYGRNVYKGFIFLAR